MMWHTGPSGVYQGGHRDQDCRQARQVRSGAFLCVPMYFYVFLCMRMKLWYDDVSRTMYVYDYDMTTRMENKNCMWLWYDYAYTKKWSVPSKTKCSLCVPCDMAPFMSRKWTGLWRSPWRSRFRARERERERQRALLGSSVHDGFRA